MFHYESLTIVRDITVRHREVDAGLENGVSARIAIDAHPGGGRAGALAGGGLGSWDDESAGDRCESSLESKMKEGCQIPIALRPSSKTRTDGWLS